MLSLSLIADIYLLLHLYFIFIYFCALFFRYDNAAAAAKKAHKEGTTLKQAAVSLGIVTED